MLRIISILAIFLFSHFSLHANNIKMCVDPNWMPFEHINQKGEYEGILADYIELFSKKSNLTFELQQTNSYKESIEALEQGLCDIIVGESPTPKLKEKFLATKAYFKAPRAFITHKDSPLVSDISQLINNKGVIGVLANSPAQELLPKLYPNANIVPFENTDIAIQNVASKHIPTFVSILPSIVYSIQQQGLTNIKIGGFFPSNIELSILVNKNKAELLPILNEAIDTITQKDKKEILNKWVKVEYKEKVDYGFIFEVVAVSLIIILAIYSRNIALTRVNKKLEKLKKELELKNDKLTILSNTDSLTGLYNRRKIDSFLEEQIELFERYKTPFSVILLDIDHFKLVNDMYGHDIGDSILIDFARLIKKNIRSSDKVGRWGGEEFMIVCPNNIKQDAIKLAQKLQELISAYEFKEVKRKTASFGVAQLTEKESVNEFLKRVDSYLYLAKNNGRNQIVFY